MADFEAIVVGLGVPVLSLHTSWPDRVSLCFLSSAETMQGRRI